MLPGRGWTAGIALLAALVLQPAYGLDTFTVRPVKVEQEVSFDGVLEAVNQATVASQTNARVEQVMFDVGDYVKKGEVIIRFRDAEQRARLASAEANQKDAQARLGDAQVKYTRTESVYKRGLLPKSAYDTAATNLKSAHARVDAATAAVKEAQEGLEHTVVRAPYSGIVVQRHIQPGEMATVGKPLMTGLSLEHLRAVVNIPQSYIGPLREHRKARVILSGGHGIAADELRIPPTADPTTHTFRVLVTLPQGDHGAFPGTLVKVAFTTGEQTELLVPAAAVVRRSEITAAYVVEANGHVSFRYIRTGSPAPDGRIPVLAGLAAGEKIALDPIAAGVAYKNQPQVAQ